MYSKLSICKKLHLPSCGWLKDKYGLSWQIVPTILSRLTQGTDPVKGKKVMEAMLKMTKMDIEKLKQAAE